MYDICSLFRVNACLENVPHLNETKNVIFRLINRLRANAAMLQVIAVSMAANTPTNDLWASPSTGLPAPKLKPSTIS